jgi:transcriptional regulator with PAS, ATPase and Fis domain
MIGKGSKSNELGCGACGYDTCRQFAVAVAQGLAKSDMCLTFALKNRQEYINNLKITNEKLAKTQKALKESEKNARKEQQSAREASETVSAMLQKLPSSMVIVDKNLKIVQANKSFIDLLGEDAKNIHEVIPGLEGADLKSLMPYNISNLFSYVIKNHEEIVNRDIHYDSKLLNVSVFTIRKNKIAGAVIRDLYVPEVRREEVIKKVSEVIDKNLSMVQQIGFLLGEGASETERMLNSIIESYKSPDTDNKES